MISHRTNRLLAALVVLTLVLSACGGTATPTASKPAAQPTTAAGTPAASTQQPVTLTYWHTGPTEPLKSAQDNLVAAFMKKYPWITVKVDSFPYAEYFQKVDTATAGKTAPDVLWVDNIQIPRYIYNKMIIPLDQFVPAGYADDWYPAPKAEMYVGGKLWSVALHQSSEAVLYNKELTDAAGLQPPSTFDKAWTFQQFKDALTKVTKKGADGKTTVWGLSHNYNAGGIYSWQPLFYAYNGAILLDAAKTSYGGNLDSDAMVAAYTAWIGLAKEGLMVVDKTPDEFQTGKVAFWLANPFAIIDIQKRFPNFKLGVMPTPCDKNCAVQSGGYHIGIHSQSKYPKEAWLLVDFLTNFDGQKQWIEQTGYMPSRMSVYNAIPKLKEQPWSLFMEGLAKYSVQRPITEVYPMVEDEFQKVFKNVLAGADVKAELKRVTSLADPELKKYR